MGLGVLWMCPLLKPGSLFLSKGKQRREPWGSRNKDPGMWPQRGLLRAPLAPAQGPDFLISKPHELPRISFWQRGEDPCQTVNFYALEKYITVLDARFQPHIFLIRWTDFSPSSLTYGLDLVVFEVCGFCNTGSNILAAFELGKSYTALLTTAHPHTATCVPSF